MKPKLIIILFFLAQHLCSQTTDTTIYLVVDKDPVFPGDSLFKFLIHQLNFPTSNKCAPPTGRIYVEFVIETNGKVDFAKIIKRVHPDYDREVLRVINRMPDWTPGYKDNKAVRTKRIIPIWIHLR